MIVYDKNTFGSNREIDEVNGYLRVDECNISKCQVRPYLGREIPNWREFDLEPDKIYNVYCPREELKKAAPTFNNLPLTREHIEVDVDNVPKEKIVGSLGDHASFEYPYLKNNLIIYDKKDIDLVMSGKKKELSCGYRYTPVRQSGEVDGKHYDFVMTDIVGNHVALVKQGRAGHDVVVSDTIEKVKEKIMGLFRKKEIVGDEFKEGELKSGSGEKVTDPKQAMAIALSEADKVAEDKDIPEKQDEPEKAGDEVALNKGEKKMADEVKKTPAEEKVEEVKEEKVTEDACKKAEDKEVKPACDEKEDKRKLIDEIGGILKDKLSEEEWRTVIKKAEELAYNDSEASADDEDKKDLKGKEKKAFAEGVVYGEEKEKAEPKKLDSEHESEGMKKAEEKKEEKAEDKKMAKDEALVMDADAIKAEAKAEVIADFKARETARRAVRKTVGDVDVFAFDSAEEIYKFACEKAGMDLNDIVSFKDAFKGLSLNKSKLAMDASPVSGSDVECFKDIRLT